MEITQPTFEEWRAQVEKDLAGACFEKSLVHAALDGIEIQPLYTTAPGPTPPPGAPPFVRGAVAAPPPFAVCMRHTTADAAAITEDLVGGADTLWLDLSPGESLEAALDALHMSPGHISAESRSAAPGGVPGPQGAHRRTAPETDPAGPGAAEPRGEARECCAHPAPHESGPGRRSAGRSAGRRPRLVIETESPGSVGELLDRHGRGTRDVTFVLASDPLARWAQGRLATGRLDDAVSETAGAAVVLEQSRPGARGVMISTTAYHDAGADAADEIALSLSTGVVYLEALLTAGLDVASAARQIAVRVSIGHDTFVELAKLRALRVAWHRLIAAAGAPGEPLSLVHAVASARTMTVRDPWVNMLRGTTQLFAAILGGADLATPRAFDEATGGSAQGRRIARNSCLVLREESHLGRIVDPAGGSYYLETLTDQLAREAWRRFQEIERGGGIREQLASGAIQARLAARWEARSAVLAKRKEAIVGVSEFANLDEPPPARRVGAGDGGRAVVEDGFLSPLPVHRDAARFEALRDRADAIAASAPLPLVTLVTLGPPAEHRARVGFASAFFSVGGLRTQAIDGTAAFTGFTAAGSNTRTVETASIPGPIVCLCGSDERYATEAATAAMALRASGARRILLAGRPGALEPALRDAGVDGFLFMGCDVPRILGELLEDPT